MRVQRWIAAFLLSGFIVTAAAAAAFGIKPGEWEVEMKISGGPPGMVPPKMKVCITPDQAKDMSEYAKNAEKNMKNCKTNITESTSDTIAFEVACSDAKMVTKGVVKKVSDSEITQTATTTMDMGGQKQTTQMSMRQVYVGPTCSKEALSSGVKPAHGGK